MRLVLALHHRLDHQQQLMAGMDSVLVLKLHKKKVAMHFRLLLCKLLVDMHTSHSVLHLYMQLLRPRKVLRWLNHSLEDLLPHLALKFLETLQNHLQKVEQSQKEFNWHLSCIRRERTSAAIVGLLTTMVPIARVDWCDGHTMTRWLKRYVECH